jgi:hypothetical protein
MPVITACHRTRPSLMASCPLRSVESVERMLGLDPSVYIRCAWLNRQDKSSFIALEMV